MDNSSPVLSLVPRQSGNETMVMEGVSGQQGNSGHGPSFRSLRAVFTNNCTALESLKVRYACVLTIRIANRVNARGMNAVSGRLSGNTSVTLPCALS